MAADEFRDRWHMNCSLREMVHTRVMVCTHIRLAVRGILLLLLAPIAATTQAQVSLNVTNFGARGDAVQFFVNTTSNSVLVTTTNHLPATAIGEAIEVFGAGAQTYGKNSYGTNAYGNQDLVATITNIVSGTNIYISKPAQKTLTSAFATYGHNNDTNFQNAIAAATGTNTIINIPAGNYLFLCPTNLGVHGVFYAGVLLNRGGIHLVGAGTNTILLSQGAWSLQGGSATRGFLFAITTPVTNDFPMSIENLTLDGGVQQGYIPVQGIVANNVDGLGWDITHDAILVYGSYGNTFTHQTWTNVVFQHWRGEMVKSTDGSTNGNLLMVNCLFNDGNATAINYYAALNVTNCTFENLFQIAEYYQAYSTGTSYFQNNVCTNINGNGFALNGGKGSNPPFIIQNNSFYSCGGNTIETMPGDNIVIISNRFVSQPSANRLTIGIALGAPGYQGTFDNSNIVVAANTFTNMSIMLELEGGTSATDPARVESVQVYSNNWVGNGGPTFCGVYGWVTNIHFFNNICSVTNGFCNLFSGAQGAQCVLVPTNNIYWTGVRDIIGQTNSLSYTNGSRFQIWYTALPQTAYALSDADSNQIPAGAQMAIFNNNYNSTPMPVFLNSARTRGPVIVTNGQTQTFSWTNGAWQSVVAVPAPPVLAPPTYFRIVASTNGP
jgi:hypothetical protein